MIFISINTRHSHIECKTFIVFIVFSFHLTRDQRSPLENSISNIAAQLLLEEPAREIF